MQFSFSQVEQALAVAHGIRDEKRSAFAHRLKHLQRLGFPPGINTGRGRAAAYSVGHLFQWGVALELVQLGLSPERAVSVISENQSTIWTAAGFTARAGASEDGFFEYPHLLYFDPANLSDLGDRKFGDLASLTFVYHGMKRASEEFSDIFMGGAPRLAFISLSALVHEISAFAREEKGPSLDDFYAELERWSECEIGLELARRKERGFGSDPQA